MYNFSPGGNTPSIKLTEHQPVLRQKGPIMKERLTAIFLFFLALLTIWAVAKKRPDAADAYGTIPRSRPAEDVCNTSSVSDEVIRLHILADSDSKEDQQIKLLIRDTLLPYLSLATIGATSKEEAETLLLEQCDTLTEIANRTLQSAGIGYSASVSVTDCYFPIRIYGSQTYLSEDAVIFPPGSYTSVQIILGRGNGHNWWCLAYPSLCFIDAAYDYIPTESTAYREAFSTVPKSAIEKLFYRSNTSSYPFDADLSGSGTRQDEVNIYLDSKLFRLWKSIFQQNKKIYP